MNARLVPLILAVALFMENMDSTVIATSLAAIAHDIGSQPIALKLALTAYLVALAIFIPISSWMADRFGSRENSGSLWNPVNLAMSAVRAVDRRNDHQPPLGERSYVSLIARLQKPANGLL